MKERDAREEICRVGHSLFARGFVSGTAGNISFRLDEGYLITPTDACMGFLDPASLSRIDCRGEHVSGDPPSKTLRLHKHIYATSEELQMPTRCVIHTHSRHCVKLSLDEPTDELLPPLTPYFVMKVGHVPLLPYLRPGHEQLGPLTSQCIRGWHARGLTIRAVMLRRIGPNVWHESPAKAMAVIEELEETAALWHLSEREAPVLREDDLQSLREAFNCHW